MWRLCVVQDDIEKCYEEMTEKKMEKLNEVRVFYDAMIKNLRPEKHEVRIEQLKKKKEDALGKAQEEIRAEQKAKLAEIK